MNGRIEGRVLIVDDVEANRDILEDLLTREGYHCETVAAGDEALRAVEREAPDLILLDVVMPGMSGFEVCQQLKGHAATRLIPVVLVTSLNEREDKIQGINAGADELDSAEDVLLSLAMTIEACDMYTDDHCHRVAAYATALGVRLELPDQDLGALHCGGYLHDVGRVGVPHALLSKPGPLTPDAAISAMYEEAAPQSFSSASAGR